MTLEVTEIRILIGTGTDKILLQTTLPESCWPYKGQATAMLTVANGEGVEYVRKHFPGVPHQVVCT